MFRVARCFYFLNIQVCFVYIYMYLFIYIYYIYMFRIFDRTMNDRIVCFLREGSSRISKQTTVKHPASERLGGLVFPLVLGAVQEKQIVVI